MYSKNNFKRLKIQDEELFAPAPEDLPNCDEFLHNAGAGEVEEAAAVGEQTISFFYGVGAEEA